MASTFRHSALALMVMTALATPASAADPKVPPGKHPGGGVIVLLSTGIDYTRPEIAARLARDGEGELVGWDFVDGDRTPYLASPNDTPRAWGGDGTAAAMALLSNAEPGGVALAPVRISPSDSVSLGKALAFAAQVSATLVVVPMATADKEPWAAFEAAASHFKDLKIAVANCPRATGDVTPRYPHDLGLANVIVTDAAIAEATSPTTAKAVTAALTSGCGG